MSETDDEKRRTGKRDLSPGDSGKMKRRKGEEPQSSQTTAADDDPDYELPDDTGKGGADCIPREKAVADIFDGLGVGTQGTKVKEWRYSAAPESSGEEDGLSSGEEDGLSSGEEDGLSWDSVQQFTGNPYQRCKACGEWHCPSVRIYKTKEEEGPRGCPCFVTCRCNERPPRLREDDDCRHCTKTLGKYAIAGVCSSCADRSTDGICGACGKKMADDIQACDICGIALHGCRRRPCDCCLKDVCPDCNDKEGSRDGTSRRVCKPCLMHCSEECSGRWHVERVSDSIRQEVR